MVSTIGGGGSAETSTSASTGRAGRTTQPLIQNRALVSMITESGGASRDNILIFIELIFFFLSQVCARADSWNHDVFPPEGNRFSHWDRYLDCILQVLAFSASKKIRHPALWPRDLFQYACINCDDDGGRWT